ncbi:hypothetical protein TYRP_015163 [Tyrophagus putrescentiae]|nr:hypothetical protein TYRP_015163 [Tyrophagus putrescentiae]
MAKERQLRLGVARISTQSLELGEASSREQVVEVGGFEGQNGKDGSGSSTNSRTSPWEVLQVAAVVANVFRVLRFYSGGGGGSGGRIPTLSGEYSKIMPPPMIRTYSIS